jgi:diguanylate cyclase (GGDEF)-like protein
VLRAIAQVIASHLRHSDVLSRYGGEEFVILLPDTAVNAACEIAERIRHAIAVQPQEIQAMVTVSVGVAALESFGEEMLSAMAQRLLASADAALYRAKQQGRDRVVVAEAV